MAALAVVITHILDLGRDGPLGGMGATKTGTDLASQGRSTIPIGPFWSWPCTLLAPSGVDRRNQESTTASRAQCGDTSIACPKSPKNRRGFIPIEISNVAYRLGVNYVMYAVTH